MAKKKIELRTSGSSVESGDVNITYNNVRIAGLSESTSAVLETEDTVCKHDIEIEYNKPSNATVDIDVYQVTIDANGENPVVDTATKEGTLTNVAPGDEISLAQYSGADYFVIFNTADKSLQYWYGDDLTHTTIVPNLAAINERSNTNYNAIGYRGAGAH